MPDKTYVGVSRVDQMFHSARVRQALLQLLDRTVRRNDLRIPNRATIMIKPNICAVLGPETGATVDPFVVRVLVEWLLRNCDVRAILIGEADATTLNADIAFRVLGWEDAFRDLDQVQLVNLSKEERVAVPLNGLCFKTLPMPRSYVDADFLISVGKLKTHTLCGLSGILKNQFGAYPRKNKVTLHPQLAEAVYDLNAVRLPDFCLIDGLVGMEGDGPVNGVPKPLGLLIAGPDPVSVDLVALDIMGLHLRDAPHLQLALRRGLGTPDYALLEARIDDVRANFATRPLWKKMVLKVHQMNMARP